ncbi:VOC family protein [Candidatus Bathyarchaeota archaeon]|nr:MAG: VOC family protein [Candidatus Bathyarchaeota archaeon]
MIKGLHALLYTPRPEELRAFIRDKLRFPFTDVGEGWLIFDMPEADLGCHPSDGVSHSISFYCDDIKKTVEELKSRGVHFTTGISDESFGLVTHFQMPGDVEVQLYEPKYRKRARSKSPKALMPRRRETKTTRR